MKSFGTFLLLVLLVLTGVWLYRKYQENKLKQKELDQAALALEQEEVRQELFNFYQSRLERMQSAVSKFAAYLNINTGYFTNAQLIAWQSQHADLFLELKERPFESIRLSADEVQVISKFNHYFSNGEKSRNEFNKNFVETELKTYGHFFGNVEGRSLDKQQRTAIVTDEENNLVIAGAGSGKTSTIVGKVHYVIDRYKVNPNEILLISFTNKSASTLATRIGIEGVDAKTFHKFGKDIIAESQGKQPTIFDENQFKPLLVKYFSELTKDQHYLKLLTTYFSKFLKPVKSSFDFENRGDYIQYMKDKSFHSYKIKEVSAKGRTTHRREVVKSMEECEIANFLLFNGIDYEYESPYEHDTSSEKFQQYKPDFTIKQNVRKIYLEHFGVARNGNVPAFFAKEGKTREQAKNEYWEKIYWKKELHKEKGTRLIETFSYEMSEGILFNNLTNQLTEAGIVLQPKSSEEVWQIIENAAKDEVSGLITLFGTFIRLMKSNNYSIATIINKNSLIEDDLTRQRNAAFIDLLTPIFERYEKHLADRG